MRLSCNGCRVLRKGCSDNCSIRPCLQWIKNPDSQANATVFLAKFYGRAGLINLINAGPQHHRPSIFRSLLYEACGRIVNPIYGSVGLMWLGSWQLCQAAVEAVLSGAPIMQIPSETASSNIQVPPIKPYDIRHVSKEGGGSSVVSAAGDLHKVSKSTRPRFKRSAANQNRDEVGGGKTKPNAGSSDDSAQGCNLGWRRHDCEPSHESSATNVSEPIYAVAGNGDGRRRENESNFSVVTDEASIVTTHAKLLGLELELTLGVRAGGPRRHQPRNLPPSR